MQLGSKQPHLATVKHFFLRTAWFGLLHLVKMSVSVFVWDTGLMCSFFCDSFAGFGIRINLVSLGSIPSSDIFWKIMRRTGINSLNADKCPVKTTGSRVYFAEF